MREQPMRTMTVTLVLICAWTGRLSLAREADAISPRAAFEKLKGLAGRWEGSVDTPDGPASVVEYRVTAAGKTVVEVMFPGSEYEMVSVYYMDGDRLVAKHFCAMGNQPEMKLDGKASSENELHFAFTGGTNMDPAKDTHMHGGKIAIRGDRLENEWMVFTTGKQEGANRFYLSRSKD
jgi:hypothetical protein